MRKCISILVVDDHMDLSVAGGDSMRAMLKRLSGNCPEVTIHCATGLRDGLEVVKTRYVDVALVDHELGKGMWGRELLARIRQERKSCIRAIMTTKPEYSRKGSNFLFQCFQLEEDPPGEPVAQKYVPRHRVALEAYILFLRDQFGLPEIDITYDSGRPEKEWGFDEFFAQDISPRLKRAYKGFAEPTVAELRYCLRHVFSGIAMAGTSGVEPVWEVHRAAASLTSLHMRKLTGGRSSSTVLACTPLTSDGHKCALCVVKVGPRHELLEELARYNCYVRFHRVSARRIELLGGCVADTLGVACYSFAGGGVDSVEVLENLLLRMEWSARDYLEHEFAFVNREWYAGASPDQQYKGIAEFFNSNHSMDAADLLQEALDDVARRDVGLSMPNGPQVATILNEMQFMSCIVHGDLNAGNILCAQSRERHCGDERDTASTLRTVLIDYRHTCRGPVFVDFAALHASLRLLPAEVDKEMMNIDELLAWERRVWLDTWGKDREWSPGPEYGYAKGLALRLGQLARINFEGGATPERGMLIEGRAKFEYAATCLLYALRLYKLRGLGRDLVSDNGGFKDLRDNCRLRLGIWVHMLATVLESGRLD